MHWSIVPDTAAPVEWAMVEQLISQSKLPEIHTNPAEHEQVLKLEFAKTVA